MKTKIEHFDLIELVKFVWTIKGLLIKIGAIGGVVGIIIAFSIPVAYTAQTRLVPDNSSNMPSGLGSLSGLASLAGVSGLNAIGGSNITPDLYPEFVKDISFIKQISEVETLWPGLSTPISSFDYYKNHASTNVIFLVLDFLKALPYRLKELIYSETVSTSAMKNDKGYLIYSKDDLEILQGIQSQLNIRQDRITGIITISYSSLTPTSAADITLKASELLKKKVINYKTKQLIRSRDYIKKSWQDSKLRFEVAQLELANYVDRNRVISTKIAEISINNLQYEYDLAFSVYQDLTNQLEQVKIELDQTIPVFTTIEPIVLPVEKSKPKRTVIILLFAIIFGVITVLIKMHQIGYFESIFSNKNEEKGSEN